MSEQSAGQRSFAAMARHLEALGTEAEARTAAAGPQPENPSKPVIQESTTRRRYGATHPHKERT